jgi:hypothetical protein
MGFRSCDVCGESFVPSEQVLGPEVCDECRQGPEVESDAR